MNYKASILVVDDDLLSLQVIVGLLMIQNPNYTIMQSKDAESAYTIATKRIPDLIISDWNMPHKSGIDLVKELKANKTTQHIPVIIATGYMISSEDLKTALDSGAVDYIAKPMNKIELEARVNSALMLAKSYKDMLLLKNNEINENSLYLIKSNEFIKSIPEKLDQLECPKETSKKIISEIKQDINRFSKTDLWERFDTSLNNLHADFYKNLLEKYPGLTPKELKISALLLLGMNIKDMASLLHQKADSIKVARYRLRKKFELNDKENLQTFLSGI